MMIVRLVFILLLMLGGSKTAMPHALDPGYLSISQINDETWEVFWRKPDVQGAPMSIDAQLPETCTPRFGPAPSSDGSAWIASWVAICSRGLEGQTLQIKGLEQQNTDVLIRYQPKDTAASTKRLSSSSTQLVLPTAPSAMSVFRTYGLLGFDHILEGLDHLLFVMALVLLIPDKWRLVGTITAFTIAHSITLALASLGHISIPGPPVEAIIALSVVFLAVELLKRKDDQSRLSERAPWVIAFAFGLLHGLGFAGALQEIGLPDTDVVLALLAFNLGVEAGQLMFVAVILVTGFFFQNIIVESVPKQLAFQQRLTTLSAYAIGGVATYWLAERLAGF
ncbi:HupE/UreJ family protein [Roseibium alexandrii]|uniref:HupE / UreJ protein n=1 Tax=Roseibium alexandrii TaxID=388408 RepID=A0A0M7AT02_9HYPH|nr:HupE/UreJ family protein [Roseibium alexandrii]CTQ76694.1 HupE / UreJ protein [Roseibium alexandrii]